jgi:hypothetical protein
VKQSLGLLCVLCCFSSIVSSAEPPEQLLEQVAHRLVEGTSLKGHFRQEKHLSFLQKSFVSSGEFSIDRSAGLHWQVLEPLTSLMVVDGSQVFLDGKRVDDHGVGQLMGLIMFGLMEGQLDTVADYFSITGTVSEHQWSLSLQPLSSRLKSVLQHIELRGDEYLREIEIFERDDNRTLIVLSDTRAFSADSMGAHASSNP